MIRNSKIRIVFQPKDSELFNGRRRFGVGVKSLHKYITESNAKSVMTKGVKKALKNKNLKERCKFRKFGIVDIYLK